MSKTMKKKDPKPFTKEELYAMIATSEQQFAAGQWQDFDEAIDEIEKSQRPYTIEELQRMVSQGEQEYAEGKWQDSEEMFCELDEEFAKEKLQHAEAV